MKLTDHLLSELEREAVRTRKAVAAVPAGKGDWAPHAKSMPLGKLAPLVASMPSWIPMIIGMDELDLTPPPGTQGPPMPKGTLAEQLDQHVEKAREALNKTTDD